MSYLKCYVPYCVSLRTLHFYCRHFRATNICLHFQLPVTFMIVTDSNDKYKDTVYCFLSKLFEQFQSKDLGTYISLFTDGPSSEFKNKYCVEMLKLLGQKHSIDTRWQYFATSHGMGRRKGVVDGIGGSAKASVRRKVMRAKGGSV